MKKLKKLTAVLLAAVMALAMLTACGGGGSSRSEKERYISKVNSYLGKGVTNFQELTYDSTMDETVTRYKDVYEGIQDNYKDEVAIEMAKGAAKINNDDYRVIQFKMDTDLKEEKRAEEIAKNILYEVKSESLSQNKWGVNYAWGEENTKKHERMIYIVLHLEEALTGNAEQKMTRRMAFAVRRLFYNTMSANSAFCLKL